MLESSSLYFATTASQEDKFEAVIPPYSTEIATRPMSRLPMDQRAYSIGNYNVVRHIRTFAYMISCWHINDDENERMWADYIGDGHVGIAIQTSVKSLQASFAGFSHSHMITIQPVKYINWEKSRFFFYGINECFQKRQVFQWENELRCAIDTMEFDYSKGNWNATYDWSKNERYANGLLVPVLLDTLIERIVIAPSAPSGLKDQVQNLCKQYGLVKQVENSIYRI
jgi:hypothetical protein